MPTSKKTTKETTAKTAKRSSRSKSNAATEAKPKQLETATSKRRFFRKREKQVYPRPTYRLPSAWHLSVTTAKLLWRHKKLFLGIVIVYGVLNLILVQGLASSSEVDSLKTELSNAAHGHLSAVGTSLGGFVLLVGSAGNNSSSTAGAYQVFLILLVSLAVIWALRQTLAGALGLRIRDAYYKGIYPLVPFILVLLVIGLQLIPMLIGSGLYSLVIGNGIAIDLVEKTIWTLICLALVVVSLYFVTSSIFALYIVTLPDMTPVKALRSARQLVRYRRFIVLRKVLFLPVILLIAMAIIMVPIIILITPLAEWVFFILTMFALAAVHGYMYELYRELLNE